MYHLVTGTSWGSIHLNEDGELAVIRGHGQQMDKAEVVKVVEALGIRIEGAGRDPRIPNMKCRVYKTTRI